MIDIAVIGFAGRFPKAKDADEYWENLREGKDCITEVPLSRWDPQEHYCPERQKPGYTYNKWGGFIEGIDLFDPLFFNIPPREAERMDPQQRLFLEVIWETFEHAGYPKERRRGSYTGVFIGISNSHYANISVNLPEGQIDGLSNSRAMIANRVSHFMDFRGPSLAVDSHCTSSLTAIHLACQSLASGECELAVAGGVSLLPDAGYFITLSQMGILSRSSKSRVFDREADGFVLGECIGALLLKRLDDALKDQDWVHAVIKGTAVNSCGATENIRISPSSMQARVMQRAFVNARIDPATISYIESGATGMPLGDVAEASGLTEAYAPHFREHSVCALGSVVPNIGNAEAAHGMAACIKVIQALRHRRIPPTIDFRRENPLLSLASTPFYVVSELKEWKPESSSLLRAAVNSFSIGGTNAHLILEEPPGANRERLEANIPFHLLVLSAKSTTALKNRIKQFKDWLPGSGEDLTGICYAASLCRDHFRHRIAFIAESKKQLEEELDRALARDFTKPFVEPYRIYSTRSPQKASSPYALKALLKGMGISGRLPKKSDRKVSRKDGGEKGPDSRTDAMEKRVTPSSFKESSFKDIPFKNREDCLFFLDRICRAYCEEEAVDWGALYRGRPREIVRIPSYPFEQESYWVKRRPTGQTEDSSSDVRHSAEPFTITGEMKREEIAARISEAFMNRLRNELHFQKKDIDALKEMSEYGFDSLFVVSLIESYEQMLGISVSPSFFFSSKNIQEASLFLADRYLDYRNLDYHKAKRAGDSLVCIVSARYEHLPLVQEWTANRETSRWLDPFFHRGFSARDFAYFLKRNDKITFIINYNGEPAGMCGLVDLDPHNDSAEAWTVIGSFSMRSRGIALQAAELLLRFAFFEKGLGSLLLKIREDNRPAIAMASYFHFRKVGTLYKSLKYEGAFFNRHMYQLTDTEFNRWIARKKKGIQ